jgi:cell division control protein 6
MATPSKFAQAAPTVRILFGAYTSLCRLDRLLHPLAFTEFKDVVNSLDTLSLISALEGKAGSFGVMNTPSKSKRKGAFGVGAGDERRFGSCVSEKELEVAVQGAGSGILKKMLSGEALD